MLFDSSCRRAAALTMSALWPNFLIGPSLALAAPIEIPNGTPVELAFPNAVNPESAIVGQTIVLHATNDVRIRGVVVIAQGAPAQGEIVASEKKGSIGKAAKIQVILRSVEAVDGTKVSLTGQKQVAGENKQTSALVITLLCCVLGLLQKGGQAEIPAGATVRGMIVGPITVEA